MIVTNDNDNILRALRLCGFGLSSAFSDKLAIMTVRKIRKSDRLLV